jgi:antitoxin YefM
MAAREVAAAGNFAEKKARRCGPRAQNRDGHSNPPSFERPYDSRPYMYGLPYARQEDRMAHVSYTQFRNNLASHMDEVCDGRAPLVVTRQNARSVVLMSEEDYDGLMETVHLLNSPANAERLLRAIADADRDMLTNARSPWPSRAERAR